MKITKENIFNEIEKKKNYLEVLRSDLVDKVKDIYDWTPLHSLAMSGVKEILSHSSVDKIKNYGDWTPLHELAYHGIKDVLHHPSVAKVKDNGGRTPLHCLVHGGHITIEDLRKKYPWYKKEIRNIQDAVTEIVNTPDSVKFILED